MSVQRASKYDVNAVEDLLQNLRQVLEEMYGGTNNSLNVPFSQESAKACVESAKELFGKLNKLLQDMNLSEIPMNPELDSHDSANVVIQQRKLTETLRQTQQQYQNNAVSMAKAFSAVSKKEKT